MRMMRSVGWLCWCWLLAGVPAAVANAGPEDPDSRISYIKLEPGVLVAGSVDDLLDLEDYLVLIPRICRDRVAVTKLSIGYVIDELVSKLKVSGILELPAVCPAEIHFRNFETGKCDLHRSFKISGQKFTLDEIRVDSAVYQNPSTSEVELCFVTRCHCDGIPADHDAVSIQELTTGPSPD